MRRERSLQPTSLGLKGVLFWLMLVTAFYVAPYINLFFLLIAFLSVLGPLATAWTWRNVAGVAGELQPLPAVPACAPARVAIRLAAGRRPRFQLSCSLELAPDGDGIRSAAGADGPRPASRAAREGRVLQLADLAALRHEQVVEGLLPPLPRGVHDVRAAWLESTYPLGVVRCRQRLGAPSRIVVHPAPAPLPSRELRGALAELGGATMVPALDMGPAGLREYREGDEVRWVHWRASARRRQLVVKEWDTLGTAGVEVQLDRRAESGAFEAALSLITALALLAHQQQEPFTLHAQGHTGTYGAGGHQPLEELLAWLAAVQPLPLAAAAPPPVGASVLRLPLGPVTVRETATTAAPATTPATATATATAEGAAT